MSQSLRIACPNCAAINRVPADRLDEAPNCGRCHQALFAGRPVALDADGFDAFAVRSQLPLLVDFWAPWCGPCVAMAPHFEQAAAVLEPRMRLARIDTQAQPELGQRFGIRSIPTLILFAGGHEVARQSGAMATAGIVQWARGQRLA